MDYKIGFLASLILLPKFIFHVLFFPMRIVSTLSDPDTGMWKKQYPDSEFIAAITLMLLTLGIYSHLLHDEVPDMVVVIANAFNITTKFGQASFWAITTAILVTWLISYIWIFLTGVFFTGAGLNRKSALVTWLISYIWNFFTGIGFSRDVAHRASRVSFIVMFLYALALFVTTVRTRTILQDSSPALPHSVIPILNTVIYYSYLMAFLYFFWTMFRQWRMKRNET